MAGGLIKVVSVLVVLGFLAGCSSIELKRENDTLKDEIRTMEDARAQARADLNDAVAKLAKKTDYEKDLHKALVEREAKLAQLEEQAGRLSAQLEDLQALQIEGVDISEKDGYLNMTLSDRVFFTSGSAKVSSKGQESLKKVAEILKNEFATNQIRVEGHTDNVQPNRVKHIFPTNWELSVARAVSVVRFLAEVGKVEAERIYASGFGEYHPVATNKDDKGRAQNRRVEIVILPPMRGTESS